MKDQFVLSPVVLKNFYKRELDKILFEKRMHADYIRSGMQHRDYMQQQVNSGKLQPREIGKMLYDDLCYGGQRQISMYRVCTYNDQIKSAESLLELIQEKYGYVSSLNENVILYQPYNDEIKDLVGIRVVKGIDGRSIKKINLIFGVRCTVSDLGGQHNEYSYVTVDFDLNTRVLFIKTKPKANIIAENQRPDKLIEAYCAVVSKLFDLTFNEFVDSHKSTLCAMNVELYDQIYKKMVQVQPKDLSVFIEKMSEDVISKLRISNYEKKKADNNIFDIQDNLTKMLEHIMISDILYSKGDNASLEGIDGYVTYIRFNDGTNISARLRGANQTSPIFSSEAYMALRASIMSAKKISELKVSWLNSTVDIRVSYDASDNNRLQILLYENHTKEEFEYAVNQYNECETRTFGEGSRFFAMEAS